jgi:hypothetical protein
VRLRSVLEVRSLNNRVHRARLLAEPAVYALGHIDVVPRGPAGPVLALLGVDCYGLGGADGLAELAGDATLVAGGVATEGVLPAETGGEVTLLKGVVYCHLGLRSGGGGGKEEALAFVHASDAACSPLLSLSSSSQWIQDLTLCGSLPSWRLRQ